MKNNKPTVKQISYATKISERTGIQLPEEQTMQSYWDYIAENKDAPDILINSDVGAAHVTLSIRKVPKHCGECPFYLENEYIDDEPMWGDGISHWCPFGAEYFGCLVERPHDCPLIIKEN